MEPKSDGRASDHVTTIVTASVLLAGLFVSYLVLDSVPSSASLTLGARIVYLTCAFLGAILSGFVVIRTVHASRVRTMWLLSAGAVLALAIDELSDLYADLLPAALRSIHDMGLLNWLAAAALVAMLIVGGSLDRLGWRRAMRVALDTVTLSVLVFVGMLSYGAQSNDVVTYGQAISLITLAAYASAGAVTASAAVLSLVGMRRFMKAWERLLALAACSFGIAMTGSPIMSIMAARGPVSSGVHSLFSSAYLLGYSLIVAAALVWLVSGPEDSRISAPVPLARTTWPTVVISTTLFLAVGLLAFWVVESPIASSRESLYFGGLVVATACMVIRTALSSSELGMLMDFSTLDDVTGAYNSRRLNERLEELTAASRRFGERFMVAVVDLDDFGEFNASVGVAAGDAMLGRVTRVLKRQAGRSDAVFRLSGDEFVVVVPVGSAAEAERMCRHMILAADSLGGELGSMSLSLGFALCPDDARGTDELLARAHSAQVWSKHHGKHRCTRYNAVAMRSLGGNKRLGILAGKSHLDVAHALSAAADARDPANYRHSRNVAALACLLAESLQMDSEHVNRLEIAAMLHDVGKLALPDALLGGKTLSIRERRSAQDHSELGARLVESLALEGVGSWVRAHHERWDGEGYPDGLREEKIPLESRIISLADAYDSMTVGHKYGAPMSKAAALQEIDLGMGTRFDPNLAERFIEVIGSTDVLGWSDEWSAA